MMIPLNLVEPWMGTIVGIELDTTVEQTAHAALTSLCESHLAATGTMPNTLFSIQNQENPMWKQRLEAVFNLKGLHFNIGMAAMAKYEPYLYNLQHNTVKTVVQQHMCLAAYNEHNTTISNELEQLKHKNALLHSGTLPPSDQDCELKVAYHHLREAEHGWNYARQ
jgi:hypothetical protein